MATVTLKGNPFKIVGNLPAVGSTAPDFRLTNSDLQDVGLDAFAGKRKVLALVPSLDTSVCAAETREFNERAPSLPNTVILAISADLPFAMKRFCATEGIQNVVPLSMMRGRNFAKDYGTLLTEGPLEGISARAIVVLDVDNRVIHTELVPEITQEPDYDAVLRVLAR